MRLRNRLIALGTIAFLTPLAAFADQHGHRTASHAPAPKSTPAPTRHSAMKVAMHGTPHAARPATTSTGHGKPRMLRPASAGRKTTAKGSPTTTKGTTGTTTAAGTNPLATKIASHPKLASKLQKMLPSGISLTAASNGFKNQGQFIAALHVSRNLSIPFRQLKMQLTGAHPVSLGQAIQTLRPEHGVADASAQVTHAEQQASDDVATTTTATTTSTTAKSPKPKARKG